VRGPSYAWLAVGVAVRGTTVLPVAGVCVRESGCGLDRGDRSDMPSGVSILLDEPVARALIGSPLAGVAVAGRRGPFGFVTVARHVPSRPIMRYELIPNERR